MMALAPRPKEFEACVDRETDFGGGRVGLRVARPENLSKYIHTNEGYVLV
jgi:hypothetical protein